MADASPYYAIRSIAVDATSWVPVVTPIAANTWSLRPLADCKIRTDNADPSTEDTIPAGMQETAIVVRDVSGVRFATGTTIAFLQAVSGTTTVKAKFFA